MASGWWVTRHGEKINTENVLDGDVSVFSLLHTKFLADVYAKHFFPRIQKIIFGKCQSSSIGRKKVLQVLTFLQRQDSPIDSGFKENY